MLAVGVSFLRLSARLFAGVFLGLAVLALGAVARYNFLHDASGVLRPDFSAPRSVEPNEHFVKMRYIIEQVPDKYDTFCFGSSRVGNLDLRAHTGGAQAYNMTYSMGLPAEWLADLRLMVAHGVRVRHVLIGLDDSSFRMDPSEHAHDFIRIPYREWNGVTYLTYALKMPDLQPMAVTEKETLYDIYDTGRPLHPWVDEGIERDVAAHRADVRFRSMPDVGAENLQKLFHAERTEQAVAEIRAIKDLCAANGITLTVFINPVYELTYFTNDLEQFDAFKRALAKVVPYYDFSGINHVTTDPYYFYEVSHYRPLTGDLMLARVMDGGEASEDGFGVLVTQEDVEEHLAAQRLQAMTWREHHADAE